MARIDKCRRDCYNVYRTPPKQIAYPRQETLLVKPQNPSKAAAENVVAETVVASPKTADAAVIAAIAAIVSGAGYMAAKKH